MSDDPIDKINRINPLRNPYAVDKDFDEMVYKRRVKDELHKHRREFREAFKKKTAVRAPEKKSSDDREKRKKWHAKYKNGKRIF